MYVYEKKLHTHIHTHTHTNKVWLKNWTLFNSERRLNTRQTFGWGIPSSVLAVRVDFPRLLSNISWIRLTYSSDTGGRPELLPLHRQPNFFKLVIPMTNVLPRWRLNVETKTKRTLHSSRRLSFNEITNANLVLHSVILLSTDAAARLCATRAL